MDGRCISGSGSLAVVVITVDTAVPSQNKTQESRLLTGLEEGKEKAPYQSVCFL